MLSKRLTETQLFLRKFTIQIATRSAGNFLHLGTSGATGGSAELAVYQKLIPKVDSHDCLTKPLVAGYKSSFNFADEGMLAVVGCRGQSSLARREHFFLDSG